ncbi:TIGR02996 domain-containing protein [Planctomicrobium sp. SH668]|uniref:TIGR02996 domain-containing protein n=1 Tax=Planctomicrobium sp. SH668 TaxID=3448126 RepID=UPI003F5C914F
MQQQPYTDQELALIEAIHAAPRDDQPRLAYADWLEQHGAGDYSEFIRLQCQQPYVGISRRGQDQGERSLRWDFPWEDKTAAERLQRLLDLLPGICRAKRFADMEHLICCTEYYRGLPLFEIEEGDWGLPMRVVDGDSFNLSPLARIDLSLYTYRSHLAEWLKHPLMFRVDVLRIWLHPAYEDKPDDEEDKDWDVEFVESDIRLLADWPLLDRLETLNLCRPISPFAEELVKELLEPRVDVDTSYGQ